MGVCIAFGTITACFGGVVRDVLLNHIPLLFRKEIYAMACIAGGLIYFLLKLNNRCRPREHHSVHPYYFCHPDAGGSV